MRTLSSALRSGGLRRVVMISRLWLLSAEDRRFEELYRLDTRSHVEVDELEIGSLHLANGFSYAPAPGRIVRRFFENVPLDPNRTAFVDFGSGKGRALLLASIRGFERVIGVEFSEMLVDIAQRNASRLLEEWPEARPIMNVHGDAAQFVIPEGDCLLHFNNPFDQEVLKQVLQNVEHAINNRPPRRIWLAWQQLRPDLEDNPSDNLDLLAGTPFLREMPLRKCSLARRWLFASHILKLYEVVFPSNPGNTSEGAEVCSPPEQEQLTAFTD